MHIVKILTDFSSAHSLRDYPGDCANIHGHNWHVEVSVFGTLDESGMVIDFRTLKQHTKAIIDRLDHKYLNDVAPFDVLNPTAEHLAKYLFEELTHCFAEHQASVYEVAIWENARSCAIYRQ